MSCWKIGTLARVEKNLVRTTNEVSETSCAEERETRCSGRKKMDRYLVAAVLLLAQGRVSEDRVDCAQSERLEGAQKVAAKELLDGARELLGRFSGHVDGSVLLVLHLQHEMRHHRREALPEQNLVKQAKEEFSDGR
jgi:hypothetical protein